MVMDKVNIGGIGEYTSELSDVDTSRCNGDIRLEFDDLGTVMSLKDKLSNVNIFDIKTDKDANHKKYVASYYTIFYQDGPKGIIQGHLKEEYGGINMQLSKVKINSQEYDILAQDYVSISDPNEVRVKIAGTDRAKKLKDDHSNTSSFTIELIDEDSKTILSAEGESRNGVTINLDSDNVEATLYLSDASINWSL